MRVFMNTEPDPHADPDESYYPISSVEVDLGQEAPLVVGALKLAQISARTRWKDLKRQSPLENFNEIAGYSHKSISYNALLRSCLKWHKKGIGTVVIRPKPRYPDSPQLFYEGVMFGMGRLAAQPEVMEIMSGPLQGADLDTLLGYIQYVYPEQPIQNKSIG